MSARSAVSDDELRVALENGLGESVAELARRPSRYATSATIEEVDAHMSDGCMLRLLLKDMSPGALLEGARRAKPAFLYDPAREIETYRTLLATAKMGTARCYASRTDSNTQTHWLLLERVAGIELYQVGEIERWQRAAAALAALHERLGAQMAALAEGHRPRVVVHDRAYQRSWWERASELGFWGAAPERLLDALADIPSTVIHGDFYASNVLIAHQPGTERVCPVDWEMVAVGPALMDLAALVSGTWDEDERKTIALSYRDALSPRCRWPPKPAAFLTALDACRLQVCAQWLGWSDDWDPPAEHAHDWRSEALTLAERVGL